MSLSKSVRSALTLLELIVVLGILAIIAGVTIQSLEPIADQARYDATVRSLEAIEAGYYQEQIIDGDRTIVRGFIADMGYLPLTLDQLWHPFEIHDPNVPLPPFGLYAAPVPEEFEEDFEEVTVACGWNGPYVQPPRTSTIEPVPGPGLRDGWGQPFALLNTPAGNAQIGSLGADQTNDSVTLPSTTYGRDINSRRIYGEGIESGLLKHAGHSLRVNITILDSAQYTNGEKIFVFAYGPVNGQASRLFPEDEFDFDDVNQGAPASTSNSEFDLLNLTIGPKSLIVAIIDGDLPEPVHWIWKTVTILPTFNPDVSFTLP